MLTCSSRTLIRATPKQLRSNLARRRRSGTVLAGLELMALVAAEGMETVREVLSARHSSMCVSLLNRNASTTITSVEGEKVADIYIFLKC